MNNLTKIAALPTGGGCQSALRPEDKGVERKPLTQREATELRWDAFYRNAPIIHMGAESKRDFSIDELVEADPAVLPVIVYGSCGRTYEVTMRDQHSGVVLKVWEGETLMYSKEAPCS